VITIGTTSLIHYQTGGTGSIALVDQPGIEPGSWKSPEFPSYVRRQLKARFPGLADITRRFFLSRYFGPYEGRPIPFLITLGPPYQGRARGRVWLSCKPGDQAGCRSGEQPPSRPGCYCCSQLALARFYVARRHGTQNTP